MSTIQANYEVALYYKCLTTAAIFQKIAEDIKRARDGGEDFIDGRYWVICSMEYLCASFPWIAERTIRYKVDKLVADGFLAAAHHNHTPFDRRRWFALEKEEAMQQRGREV